MGTFTTNNPFKIIVESLSECTWKPVTLEYLEWVHATLKTGGVILVTYGEVVQVLEYLETSGIVEIQRKDSILLIKKAEKLG